MQPDQRDDRPVTVAAWRFRVLGPVEVESAWGELVRLARRQERCLLGVLLLEAGRMLPVDRLADLLWDGNPPANARAAVRSHVARIRAALAACPSAALVSHGDGYELRVDAASVDAHRFKALIGRAGSTTDPAGRDALLREALALWRGPVLHNAASDQLRQRLCVDLDEQRRHAVEESLAIGLELGRHDEVLPELARLAAEPPVRERLIELQMTALYRQGRTSEALDAYHHARQRLADELGLDPGPALRQLHKAILAGQPVPARPQPRQAPQRTRATPAQLPAGTAGFAGRGEHLDTLDALAASRPTAVVISAIAGTAGVGKTALAVHWAHQIADRFPDGQLYVNLRGFDPSGQIMDPATAVRGFLDALEVPLQRIPTDPDAQAALYRSLLSNKRMLVVLDNARDTAQVRPLLPGAPRCLVVVTSRNQLTSLIAGHGAHPIILDLLTHDEAHQLLARRLNTNRVAAEPDAVEEIITRCARLPLALTLVAAHAAVRPRTGLRILAEQLRDTHLRWQTLTGDDDGTDVPTVFSWSYQALSEDSARLFRLLGLHPGPDISAPAAASLAAVPIERVRPLLAELTRTYLISEDTPSRYTFHDLLRAYANQLAHTDHPDQQRHAITHRLLDHYLHTAHTAARLLDPHRDPITLTPPQPGVTPEHPTDHQQALEWFTAEHPVLLAALDHAAITGFDTHIWPLAWTLDDFLDWRGHWHDWAATWRAAVTAAQRLADPIAQTRAHRYLAHTYLRLGRVDDAHTHLRHALDLSIQAGDQAGEAHIHLNLAQIRERQGRHSDALDHARQALDLFRAAGHQRGQALALNTVGWYHALLGDHRQALTCCEQALTQFQELDDRLGQAATWDRLGYTHHHLGHHTQAITYYQHTLDLSREISDRHWEADILAHLGDTHHAAGNHTAARDAYQQALDILTDLNHPDAAEVGAKLATFDISPTDQPPNE